MLHCLIHLNWKTHLYFFQILCVIFYFQLSDDVLISRMEAYLQIQNTFNISEGRASGAVYTDIDDQTHQFVVSINV